MNPSPQSKEPSLGGLRGLTVAAFESRRAAETASLIARHGGIAMVAPSMREVPIEENPAAIDFASRLTAGEFQVVIFLTGVGVRTLFAVLEPRFSKEDLVGALKNTLTVARGPKPIAALRELGLEAALKIPEPNTWREVLSALAETTSLSGKHVAVQEYGVANRDLVAGLEARGAKVASVSVYRWSLPLDQAPLKAALKAIVDGKVDVALFTSATQVTNLLQVAEASGLGKAARQALKRVVVCSVGPVCSEALRRSGLNVDLEPEHPKLGHLIKAAAEAAVPIVERKRRVRIEIAGAPQRLHARHVPMPSHSQALRDHPMMKACRLEATPYTPIWLMRQAGRYMPEYREVREHHSFLEMCQRPELAAEVTVGAVERLGVDAAIIFSDILLPLVPMRVGLRYEKGDGPVIEHPIRTAEDLDRIPAINARHSLEFVGEAIRLARYSLGGKVPLIGFAGAPFTLASYLIEGGGSRQYRATKTFMYKDEPAWHRLMETLADVTAEFLNLQIDSGADIVQLFDSWVGSLGPDDYRRFVLPHTAKVINRVRPGVPVIHFGTVTGNLLELMREAGGDIIGLDWRVDLAEAWERLGPGVGVQGNLDPVALFADVDEIRSRARAILDQAHGRPGHIFNLGHGILPETSVDHAISLVDAVHELSLR